MIDSNFWKLFTVHSLNRVVDRNYRQCGSNEICRTTLELKTDSNVELDRHVRNKYEEIEEIDISKTSPSASTFDSLRGY